MSNPALVGNELLQVQGVSANGFPSATTQQTTTGAIAALASSETSFVSTNITTVGNGTLTAAGMIGDQIVRTGPVANFSDTTDTAAAIVALFPGGIAAGSNYLNIKNATAFTQTLLAGTGVTLPITVIIPPFAVGEYVVAPTSATAVTLTHIETNPISIGQNTTNPTIVSLATVGAGVITAANFAGGLTARGGSQSGTPFTDTTDTAANIIAACANLIGKVGSSFIYYYNNATNAVATLSGVSGVTVSGITVVPSNMTVGYLVTYTAAATITMVGIGLTNSLSTAMALVGSSSGQTIIQPSAAASGTLTLPAATDTLVGKATTDTLTNKTLTDVIDTDTVISSSATTSVSTTTPATITGLTVSLTAAGKYSYVAQVASTTNGTAGVKVSVGAGGGALTATNFQNTSEFLTAAGLAVLQTTTLDGAQGSTATVLFTRVTGAITVATAGPLTVQGAQNVSTTGTTTFLANSFLTVKRAS